MWGAGLSSGRCALKNNGIARFGLRRIGPRRCCGGAGPYYRGRLRVRARRIMKSDLPGIPADHEFLAFLKGCDPPTQFYDILTRRTFDYSLFFDPKPEGLGRWAFN